MIKKKKSIKKSIKKRRKKHYPYAFFKENKQNSILGGGCFGEIYLMKNLIDNQIYAVKHIEIKKIQTFLTLLKGRTMPRSKTLEFIFNEAKILAKLNHENIIRYYNTRYTRDIIYISLEVMDGGNLEEAIVKKTFLKNPKLIYDILIQICSGLNYLHGENILHRDIKASNILICNNSIDNMKIKLGDFGLSSLLEKGCYHQTNNQTGAGDIFYRSPEAVTGKAYDKGDDNWAVGVVLLEIISGIILSGFINGKIFSLYTNLQEYIDSIIEDYCILENKYYKRVETIVRGLLNKDPLKRLTTDKILEISKYFLPCLVRDRRNTFDIRGTRLLPIDNANLDNDVRPKSA